MNNELSGLRLIPGNSNPRLWDEIAANLHLPLTPVVVKRFADGEIQVQIEESVRDDYCVVLQSTCDPVNDHLMELLLLIDALRRASAGRIGVVTPYYGYARQDKKLQPREPISARVVADLIERVGAQRFLAMDLHSNSIQGFFNIPVDHLTAANLLCDQIREDGWAAPDCVVVSPDVGGVERASYVANELRLPIAIIAKRRPEPNACEVVEVVGDVRGRRAVMVDDMVDTAGSTTRGGNYLVKEGGATGVRVYAAHGVFGGNAAANINKSVIELVTVTNTIPPRVGIESNKIRYISAADLIGRAVYLNFTGGSVSSLFRR
ncbi:MAG: ribose-phosphate pyrophosphokinase [bacterium]